VDELTFQQLKSVAENPLIEPKINVETGPCMILAYVEKETNIHSKYRYEMQELNYTVTIASETILLQILYKYWQELKGFFSPTGLYYQSNPLLCGHIFEAVGKIFIQFGGTFDVYSCPSGQEPLGRLELKQKGELLSKGNSWWDYFVECSKLPSSDTVHTRKALIPNACNQPFIDMMDACDRAYQFTTAPSHSLNRKYLQQLLSCNPKFSEKNPLKIYYVIPQSRLAEFKVKYSNEIVHPFEFMNVENLERLVTNFLENEEKMKEEEIHGVISQLGHSSEKLRTYLEGKMGLDTQEKKKEFLDIEWIKMQNRFQCFILCLDESLGKENPKILEFIKSLYESRNSKLDTKE
jgi:hypothetical protein